MIGPVHYVTQSSESACTIYQAPASGTPERNVVIINVISVRGIYVKEYIIYSPCIPLNQLIHEHEVLVKSQT